MRIHTRYSDFLREGWEGGSFNGAAYTSRRTKLSEEEFKAQLAAHCTHWNADYTPMYRSVDSWGGEHPDKSDYWLLNPSSLTRAMKGGAPLVASIVKYHPDWARFPDRQKSVMLSTCFNIEKTFDGTLYVGIPFDNASLGICPSFDFNSGTCFKNIPGFSGRRMSSNPTENMLRRLHRYMCELTGGRNVPNATFGDMLRVAQDVDAQKFLDGCRFEMPDVLAFASAYAVAYAQSNRVLTLQQHLLSSFSPRNLEFALGTVEDTPAPTGNYENSHEIWTDSNVLLIEYERYVEMRQDA